MQLVPEEQHIVESVTRSAAARDALADARVQAVLRATGGGADLRAVMRRVPATVRAGLEALIDVGLLQIQ